MQAVHVAAACRLVEDAARQERSRSDELERTRRDSRLEVLKERARLVLAEAAAAVALARDLDASSALVELAGSGYPWAPLARLVGYPGSDQLDETFGRYLAEESPPSAEELKQAKDAVEKITDKVRQLRSEQEALVNPLEGSRLALEAWIQQTTRGAAETPELKQAIEELRGQFESLQQAKSAKARLELVDKEALAQSKAELETAQAEIQDAYDRGAISLDEYYRRRRDIIERAAESELAVLRAKQARAASEEERGEVGL